MSALESSIHVYQLYTGTLGPCTYLCGIADLEETRASIEHYVVESVVF